MEKPVFASLSGYARIKDNIMDVTYTVFTKKIILSPIFSLPIIESVI